MGYIFDLRKKVGHDPLIMVCSSAIILNEHNEILLQLRKDMVIWGLHGGSMDLGESIEETLIREVYEETNIKVISFEPFKTYSGPEFMVTYPNKDVVYLVENVFIVNEYSGQLVVDPLEVLQLKWFKLTDIPWDNLMPTNKIILKDFLKEITDK